MGSHISLVSIYVLNMRVVQRPMLRLQRAALSSRGPHFDPLGCGLDAPLG